MYNLLVSYRQGVVYIKYEFVTKMLSISPMYVWSEYCMTLHKVEYVNNQLTYNTNKTIRDYRGIINKKYNNIRLKLIIDYGLVT